MLLIPKRFTVLVLGSLMHTHINGSDLANQTQLGISVLLKDTYFDIWTAGSTLTVL